MKRRDLLAGSRIPLQPLNSLVLISLFPIGPSTLHPHSAFPPRPIPHFVGSFNLPAVAGRLQTAAAVAQEGSISISVPPRPPRPALASQLFVNLEHPPNRLLQPPATAASPSVESSMSSLRLSPQPWLARHESTIRSTSCSAVHHHQDRAGQSQHAHIRPRTPSWIHSCGRCRFRAADAARFKQSIPRRPRRLASRGISWHSAGRSSGRPPGPQTGLAKLAKHNKQHSSGPLLVPPLPPPTHRCVPQRQRRCESLGLPKKLFVSSLAALRAQLLLSVLALALSCPAACPIFRYNIPLSITRTDHRCQSVASDASVFPLRLEN